MKVRNAGVALLLGSMLFAGYAMAQAPVALDKAGSEHATGKVDCSKTKDGKKATLQQVRKCEEQAKASGKQ